MVTKVHPPESFVEFSRDDVEGSIPGRFERQVARYPGRLAVKVGQTELTFADLNRAANRVARALLAERGPEPEQVALLFERDAAMVAAALGVLKAGKVWVPLDVTYPHARNAYLLGHAQATVLVTGDQHLPVARELVGDGSPLLNIDQFDAGISDANINLPISPDAVACILYTSGSTGVPRGVVHNHRNLLHFIMRYTNALRISPEDRVSQLASCSHIAGVSDVLRGLLNGAAVLPFDPKERAPAELAEWLAREGVTICHLVPTLFRRLAGALGDAEDFPRLRLLHVGGESVSRVDVELYKRHFPRSCVFLNNLGCTEVSSFRQYLIDHQTEVCDAAVPVGYAVEDTDVTLLDEAGAEVPLGQIGEIVVRSRYLALGYWREPDLTSSAFGVASGGGGARTYRTGDMGRMLSDDCLVHLGRKDFQVQIRGYRVEVVEIEKALLESAGLEACAVVPLDDSLGEKQLVAYLVAIRGEAPTTSELRDLVQERLPAYMVPAAFVWLDALPILPNGKLDRGALPPPDWSRPGREQAFVAPRNAAEELVARIWADVLGVERVGIHDHFVELGGHSLSATQVVSRVRRTFRVELPLRRFFERPTVEGMVTEIAKSYGGLEVIEEIAQAVAALERLSDDEVKAMLSERADDTFPA